MTEQKTVSFAEAWEALLAGKKIKRLAWSPWARFLYFVEAQTYKTQTDVAKEEYGDEIAYCAYVALARIIDGVHSVDIWSPSCRDMLYNDWVIL